jgi:hypothetical protein
MKTPNDFIQYKDDVKVLKEFLETKNIYWTIAECFIIWEAFSDSVCASFLGVDDEWLDLFMEWLGSD